MALGSAAQVPKAPDHRNLSAIKTMPRLPPIWDKLDEEGTSPLMCAYTLAWWGRMESGMGCPSPVPIPSL